MDKKYLTIDELRNSAPSLDGHAADFVADSSASNSDYISDAITEFADGATSIHYADIMKFISENPEALEDAINEFGWDGCGSDLHKAGQMAEFLTIEREIYDNLDDIKKALAINYMCNIEAKITADQLDELFDALDSIDNNDRLDAIADAVNDIINQDEV